MNNIVAPHMLSNLTIISSNVNGINNPIKRKKILEYFKRQQCDILLLQETHLTDTEHEKLKRDWVGTVLYNSYNSKSRGVAVLFHKKIGIKILKTNKDQEGRMLIVKFDFKGMQTTVINIYAPNGDDSQFYKTVLLESTQSYGQCIIGGDFNLILNPCMDKSSKGPASLSKDALALREDMKDLGYIDIWRVRNPTEREYSHYSHVHKVFTRIDLFLIPSSLESNVLACEYLPRILSDHSPLKIKVKVNSDRKNVPKRWKLNTQLLNDSQFSDYVQKEIVEFLKINTNTASASAVWESLLAYIRGQIISYTANQKRENKKIYSKLEEEILHLERQYTENQSEIIKNHLTLKRHEFNNLLTAKVEKQMAITKYHYYEKGEKTGKMLSWLIKKQEQEKTIKCIKNSMETMVDDPLQINKCFEKYYRALYKTEVAPNTKYTILNKATLATLSEDMKHSLDADLSEKEVKEAILMLKPNKAAGPDGFPAEFFKKYINLLVPPLIDMFKESFGNKKLPNTLEQACIKVFLKPGKNEHLCSSYRPISLLNVSFKVLSKILANRLEKCIGQLIHVDQTGFIKNRQGSDNIRKLFHVLEVSKHASDARAVIAIDAEKAFDRIEWNFVFKTLQTMNFGNNFLRWIQILYRAPVAMVTTNGITSEPFILERGCRQGCCLSPLLFAIAIEPLASAIRNNAGIKGIKIGNQVLKTSLYADDLLLYVTDPKSSLPHLMDTLEDYSKSSGYKINYAKSEIMPLNVSAHNQSASINCFKWSPKGLRYLGIFISNDLNQIYKLNYVPLVDLLRANIHKWKDLHISLIGKVNLVKMAILPKFLFLFQSIPLKCPASLFKTIDSLISKFIWSFKHVRIKLSKLKAPFEKGGINLPDFKLYYNAAQIRNVWLWSQPYKEGYTPCWVKIEQHLCQPLPIDKLKYFGDQEGLREIVKNPILCHTLKCWQNCHKIIGLHDRIFTGTPLWHNPALPSSFSDGVSNRWKQTGICTIGDLCQDGIFQEFSNIKKKYNLALADSFKYLQIKSWLKNKLGKPPSKINESLLCTKLESITSPTKLMSTFYTLINQNSNHDHLSKKE